MHIMLLVVLLFTDGVESAASAPPGNLRDIIATRSLAEVALPPGVLGDGWKPSRGIRIADFAKLDGLPPQEQEIARKLKEQFTPLGVRAVADYTLVRTEFPLNTVTVRVFLFDTPEAAHAWWERKYRHDGWEK